MKEKLLELKHLAPYLPYGLKIYVKEFNTEYITNSWGLKCQSDYLISCYEKGVRKGLMLNQVKPILRPLSDLTDRINPVQHHTYLDGLNHNSIEKIQYLITKGILYLEDYNYLIEHHFDVFGLIEKGLAVNINNL